MKFIKCKNKKKTVITLVKVSDEDYEKVSELSWYISSTGYVVHSLPGGGKISLHRFIMEPEQGMVVDHIDGDPTNNTRNNLRVCTSQENSTNRKKAEGTSSRFKGTYPSGAKWRAYITIGKKQKYLGTFNTEFEAAQAYDRAALDTCGWHACTNFPAQIYMQSLYTVDDYHKMKESADALKEAI